MQTKEEVHAQIFRLFMQRGWTLNYASQLSAKRKAALAEYADPLANPHEINYEDCETEKDRCHRLRCFTQAQLEEIYSE